MKSKLISIKFEMHFNEWLIVLCTELHKERAFIHYTIVLLISVFALLLVKW